MEDTTPPAPILKKVRRVGFMRVCFLRISLITYPARFALTAGGSPRSCGTTSRCPTAHHTPKEGRGARVSYLLNLFLVSWARRLSWKETAEYFAHPGTRFSTQLSMSLAGVWNTARSDRSTPSASTRLNPPRVTNT